MTIEEKAKAYDEAIRKAKITLGCCDSASIITEHTIYDIFPELKESEDERIRKWLIEYFKEYKSTGIESFANGLKIDSIIAWLEKQESVGEIVERCKTSWYNEGKIAGMTEGLTDEEKYQQGWHDALEKQGEQKTITNVPSREVILSIWDLGNEWKELTNGRNSTEYGTQLNYIQKHWHESEYYLREKQGEQMPVDKVEVKFKVGYWVIIKAKRNEYVKQIVRIEYFASGHPQYIFSDGLWFGNGTEARLWTIQDAKNGDVLSGGTTIFIFKDSLSDGSVMSYCDYDTDSGKIDAFCPLPVNLICSKITPATKEQRDLLFKKMHEAGYMWDANKKELKKIELYNDLNKLKGK